jgi:hypothetical protein
MRSELKEVKKKIDDEDKARKDARYYNIYHFFYLIFSFVVHPKPQKMNELICLQKLD